MNTTQEKIKSPLVPDSKAVKIKTVSVQHINEKYKSYGIDTSYIFGELKELSIYECESSCYRFYSPEFILGDSAFYEILQRLDWYYMPWKWEHDVAKSFLNNGMSLLEVGCAHGAFIKSISDDFELDRVVGLELNKTTTTVNKKFRIINEEVQSFQENIDGGFDVVCSFQVLEHVYDVRNFLNAKIKCLKNGGKLIISVPNNESFIRDTDSALNMPPHHIGLWSQKSLRYLEEIFSLKFLNFYFEPLQSYHVPSYVYAKHYASLGPFFSRILRKVDQITGRYEKMCHRVEFERNSISGHTVLAVFEKKTPQP